MAMPYRVRDVMSRTVISVSRDTPFKEIVAVMGLRSISALPVLDAGGRVVGVVSEADLMTKEAYRFREPSRREQASHLRDLEKAGGLTAADVMTGPAVTVGASATLAEAARLMARHHVKRLPVVDRDRRPVGVVSRGDLLKVFLQSDARIAEQTRRELMERLPGVDASRVAVTVADGVVTLEGEIHDARLVPVADRIVRAIDGVVDVDCRLHGPAGWRPVRPIGGPPR